MSFLIDTNIISEVRKQHRCDANVARWFASIDASELYLSALVLGEIRRGIEKCRSRDAVKASALASWLNEVRVAFEGRILPVDAAVAEEWGRISAARSLPVVDGLLAATAKVAGLTLVTRNLADVAGLGVSVLDPFVARYL